MPAKCGSSPRAKVGIDLVGQAIRAGQAHVERPLLLAPPAILGQPALGLDRLPAARLAGVEIGMVGAPHRPGAKGKAWRCAAPGRWVYRTWAALHLWLMVCLASESRAVLAASSAAPLFSGKIIGDRRAIGGRVLRIVPHLVEDEQARAELERLGDVVRDHEDGHAGFAPDGQQKRPACRARMPGSSAPNGSSSSRIFGRFSSAWAMASRCCMPPESCAG